jgi:hypothetical protein
VLAIEPAPIDLKDVAQKLCVELAAPRYQALETTDEIAIREGRRCVHLGHLYLVARAFSGLSIHRVRDAIALQRPKRQDTRIRPGQRNTVRPMHCQVMTARSHPEALEYPSRRIAANVVAGEFEEL